MVDMSRPRGARSSTASSPAGTPFAGNIVVVKGIAGGLLHLDRGEPGFAQDPANLLFSPHRAGPGPPEAIETGTQWKQDAAYIAGAHEMARLSAEGPGRPQFGEEEGGSRTEGGDHPTEEELRPGLVMDGPQGHYEIELLCFRQH